MRIVKATVLGLAIAGFTAGSALACGWDKTAQTSKPDTKQTTVTNDQKSK